jgi:hypothetical protein
MQYAIVQTSLIVPSVVQMQKALQVLPQFAGNDASLIAQDACGVIVHNLNEADAHFTCRALIKEGVDCEVVEETAMPALPSVIKMRRFDCEREHLILYDLLGRKLPIPWANVVLVAAGSMPMNRSDDAGKRRSQPQGSAVGSPSRGSATDEDRFIRRESILDFLLDVDDRLARYRFESTTAQYEYLGGRRSIDEDQNFGSLVGDMTSHATGAVFNRGATSLAVDGRTTYAYNSVRAFEEETIWQLRQGSAAAAAASPGSSSFGVSTVTVSSQTTA